MKKKGTYALIDREKNEKRKRENKGLTIIYFCIILALVFLFYFSGLKMAKIGYKKEKIYASDYIEKESLIKITEDTIEWNEVENLRIFSNPEFDNEKIIEPNSMGRYSFFIENTTYYDMIYSIAMKETNKHNINMKYRLKIDNSYIIGDENSWVKAEELCKDNMEIRGNSKNMYTLEWLWEEAENDTEIGKEEYATYKLQIEIYPERIY